MAGVGALGVLSFALLRPVTQEAAEAEKTLPDSAKATSFTEQLFEVSPDPLTTPSLPRCLEEFTMLSPNPIRSQVVRLVLKVDMLLLAPAIIYTGFTQAFFPGQIPLFIYNFGGGEGAITDSSIKLVRRTSAEDGARKRARARARDKEEGKSEGEGKGKGKGKGEKEGEGEGERERGRGRRRI